ncbi:hypothetical protein GRI89_03840 [Altererythrobacter salegens]|uniref:Peptidase M56 domain-containing protein n=1 Tax=Croceibacterium salegens TaxID=1737568 RepID=A0A6I4SS18_9SPHN|nr:M56 family metallopeptidase [Croceibacterium salegens]MXO58673.1 hypothetical protein [Croceibacterium salegens]
MSTWLIDTALYTGLLIAAVMLLRRPVSRIFGPTMAYALWALPLLRFILPPIVLPASMAPQAEAVIAEAAPQLSPQAAALVADALANPVVAEPAFDWASLILPVWLVGAALLLAWRLSNYRNMRREVLHRARPVGEVGKVRLVESAAVNSPVAFGVFDKVVALPTAFMAMEDRQARDLAIAHELAHHRGHDIAANFAAQPLLALHWFNPIAWAGWRAMRRDQEAACDARVVAGRDLWERAQYADVIAGFATGPRLALAAPMACPMLREKSIIHRLRSLSMSDVSRRRRIAGRLLFGAATVALPLTASVSYAAGQSDEIQSVELAPSVAAVPEAPEAPLAPEAPAAPEAPVAPEAVKEVHVFKLQRTDGDAGDDGQRRVFVMRSDGQLTDEQRRHFEAMAKEYDSEKWQKFAERQAKMAEKQAEMAAKLAEKHLEFAWNEADVPLVEERCDGEGTTTKNWTDDSGRKHIMICERAIERMATRSAAMGLRAARDSIARNREMSADVRDEVLEELDAEIQRIERGED